MTIRRAAALATGLIALAGCGPSLGSYEVTEIALVDDLPDTYEHSREPEPYLRIELESDFDLVADGNGNIYSRKVDCGYFDTNERGVFGPLAAGDPPLDLYDALPAMKRNAAGRAVYLVFVPVVEEERPSSIGAETLPGYDLRTREGDLCLKIVQVGYFITESASKKIRIPAENVARVIRSAG